MLVVANATASARQVRFPILCAIRDAGPTSPHDMVENIGSVCSEPWHTFLMEFDSARAKK